jgi:AcrR family transcriptional regulator
MQKTSQNKVTTPSPLEHILPSKRVRADAQRNEDAVLEAAKQIFKSLGVDAPVRDIAVLAGVGVGTLYRRFPKRADLIAAVFRREVDACADEACNLAHAIYRVHNDKTWARQRFAFW